MHGIIIERAKVSDARRILEIQKEAYLSEAELYDDYDIPPLTQTLAQMESDFDSHTYYVAKLEAFELFTGHKSKRNLSFYGKRGYLEFERQTVHERLVLVYMRK